ncbi:MAG: glutamate racemase [Candidatus Omnitrophota bacterium]
MNNDKAIGIFDSGLGGLTVVKEAMKVLPYEDIIYFGDTARVPYGTKSKKTIEKFSRENAAFLSKFKVKLIVVACNTSSSLALDSLKRNFEVPVVGVIEAGVREAFAKSSSGRIGVIGTRATISSGVYQKALNGCGKGIKVFSASCPLFVPLVEEGWLNKDVTTLIAAQYLKPLINSKVDTLILGCTHYPLLKNTIGKVMGKRVTLINSATAVAVEVKNILEEKGLKRVKRVKPEYKFFVSDEPKLFLKEGSKFLGRKITNIKRVNNV